MNPLRRFVVREDWMVDGNCLGCDPEMFMFTDRVDLQVGARKLAAARKICHECDVQSECLAYALNHHELGIWGGTTEDERKSIVRRRRRNAAAGKRLTAAAVLIGALLFPPTTAARADEHLSPGPTQAAVQLHLPPKVQLTLQVLDRLHSFGYSINTPARADRAIRHWQRANGLVVDGIVGPQTWASLFEAGSAPTASAPAVRRSPTPPALDTDVEAIIRDVWPDDLEDHAVAIATRESRLVPTARNACCYGLFQIHWSAHHGWLAGIGITSPSQLLDARTNATAALALYERDGWGPWAL